MNFFLKKPDSIIEKKLFEEIIEEMIIFFRLIPYIASHPPSN
jgi:hypothetical protein